MSSIYCQLENPMTAVKYKAPKGIENNKSGKIPMTAAKSRPPQRIEMASQGKFR
jgi:hypothetical protein